MPHKEPSALLETLWNQGSPSLDSGDLENIPKNVRDAIESSINSTTKTYRYVLPSQLLAKLCDPKRDAHTIQNNADIPGSFDARSFCHSYIVPFDRNNHSVLGGSPEPYVNNPLRIPAIDSSAIQAQRNKTDFKKLIAVLDYAEGYPESTRTLLILVLIAISKRLEQVSIVYPVPNRAPLKQTIEWIDKFLSSRTGGRRLQSVSAALFDVIGSRFGLYARVKAGHINRSDAASGDIADLDCVDDQGKTILAVEVKDRQLTVREVEDKLPAAREKGVAEILYLIRGGVESDRTAEYKSIQEREFSAGHNLYA